MPYVWYNTYKGGDNMKVRFVTTLDSETITELRILAAKQNKPVNAIITELVDKEKQKGD